MDVRKQLIKSMQGGPNGLYKDLKSCITGTNVDEMDVWFKGCIESLYYRPNKRMLVLEGDGQGFLSGLHPDIVQAMDFSHAADKIHSHFIVNLFDIFNLKRNVSLSSVNFVVRNDGSVDKRLASYIHCSENYAKYNSTVIVVGVEHVNWTLYNNIPKDMLWEDIFHLFKPEGK